MDPVIFYILAASIAGFSCGFLAAYLPARHKVRRASMASWRQASIYFRNRYRIQD